MNDNMFCLGSVDRETGRSSASSRQGAGDRSAGAERQLTHLSTLLAESEDHNSRLEKLTEVRTRG